MRRRRRKDDCIDLLGSEACDISGDLGDAVRLRELPRTRLIAVYEYSQPDTVMPGEDRQKILPRYGTASDEGDANFPG
jgi:hypothetical protein